MVPSAGKARPQLNRGLMSSARISRVFCSMVISCDEASCLPSRIGAKIRGVQAVASPSLGGGIIYLARQVLSTARFSARWPPLLKKHRPHGHSRQLELPLGDARELLSQRSQGWT